MRSSDERLAPLLKSVSRSFYLSLRVLPAELRPAMGLGYLLCRAADTIADTDAVDRAERISLLRRFDAALSVFPPTEAPLTALASDIAERSAGPPGPEADLLRRLDEAFRAYLARTRTEQAMISEVARAVVRGMILDQEMFPGTDGVSALPNEDHLAKYIGWIGGAPGRFWTKLCEATFPDLARSGGEARAERGYRFGTGLQMVNILRDLPQDLRRGRCYLPLDELQDAGLTPDDLLDQSVTDRFLPLYHRRIDETLERLRSGLDYVRSLPRGAWRLRAAVWWPLAIGVRTLARLRANEKPLDPERRIKIARREVYGVLALSALQLPFNAWLEAEFEDRASLASSASDLSP